MVLIASSVLGQGGHPEAVLETVSYCLEQICSPAYRHMGGLQFGFGLIDDVISLLSLGTSALVCSLSDLRSLVRVRESEFKSEKPKNSRRVDFRSKLKLVERDLFHHVFGP